MVDNGTSYDPYVPPKLLSSPTTLYYSQMILPLSPELEVSVLGESSLLTDITSVMEPSLGDLAASASRPDRGGALCGV